MGGTGRLDAAAAGEDHPAVDAQGPSSPARGAVGYVLAGCRDRDGNVEHLRRDPRRGRFSRGMPSSVRPMKMAVAFGRSGGPSPAN